MTTSTLRYQGPRQQARAQLAHLLKEFPQVLFHERDTTEYEVTASDASILEQLAAKPDWSLVQDR